MNYKDIARGDISQMQKIHTQNNSACVIRMRLSKMDQVFLGDGETKGMVGDHAQGKDGFG